MPDPPSASDALAADATVQRRRSPRYLCEGTAEAIIVTPEAEILLRGNVCNISLHGCFVQTHTPARLVLESAAEVRFKVNGRTYRCAALVRNIQPGVGAAFEFHRLTAAMKGRIAALIRELAEEASNSANGLYVGVRSSK